MLTKIRKILIILGAILAVVMILYILFRITFSDAIRGLAETQVRNSTSDLINDAIDDQIEKQNIQYDRIVYFEKDLNGRITALKTNLNLINDEILAMDTSQLGIPVGSLLLPEILSGRGPQIPVQILAIRNSDAMFSSGFVEAGINQTLHQLSMSISVDVAVLVLGETNYFTVSSHVVVAETIIVGQVPDTYFQTGGYYGRTKEN